MALELRGFGIALAIAVLPWWPGGSRGIDGVEYRDHVPVINTLSYLPHLAGAIRDWNACNSRLHLVRDDSVAPYTPKTITITRSDDGGAYGGWNGTAGVMFLGGGWTRTLHVLSHEMGHALGFGHAKRADSVMHDSPRVTDLDCRGLRNFY